MKEALRREHAESGVLTEFGGHEVGETGADYVTADPSSVDQVGRPGVPHSRGEGTLNR